MSDDKTGTADTPNIAFVQYGLPPLKSGNFTINVTQKIAVSGTEVDSFHASQAFYVAGERYGLAATDIDSVFPPQGNQGEFSNNLAHVVFTKPTLPWQRSPNAVDAAPMAGQPVPSWLGVLLFDQYDPPPPHQNVTLAHLAQPPAGIFFPTYVAEDGENPTDAVTVIDIPVALFNAIAPSLADLNWNAHVRVVDASAKAGDAVTAVDYAVVFGNRLPVAGHSATAHLVSFEDFGSYLPEGATAPIPVLPAGTTAVRMVTLRDWSFSALDLKQTFAGLLTQVNLDPPGLQLRYNSASATGVAAADIAVENAFGMGFTAMNHALRDGSATVSWYRGPLLPLAVAPSAAPPWDDADQLMRYDPATGMFDTSYASAWQLGRLLAMHDSAYAAALYRWKLTETQAQVAALEQQVIDKELALSPSSFAPVSAGTASMADLRQARLKAVVKGLVGPAAAMMQRSGPKE